MSGPAALTRESKPRMEETIGHESWHDWFRRFGPRLLLCARQWTSHPGEAEDIVQDAFVRYWRWQRRLGGDALPLLLVSIRRAAYDRARKNGRREQRERRVEAESGGENAALFTASFEAEDRRRALEGALAELPGEQREVVVLRVWAELTFDEIGRQLSIPPATAASRYRYGLAAMRRVLAPANPELNPGDVKAF